VQAILASRIDRLPADEKDLLQTLAVIGADFSLGLIEKVIVGSRDELERMLSDLQLGEFIYEQPALPDVEYSFKHALTQDVAYNSILIEKRKNLHRRIGDSIEALFGNSIEDHYTALAHHYGRSADSAKAIDYMSRAGEQAIGRSAVAEGINYLSSAIELLKTERDPDSFVRQEIRLQMALGAMYAASKGYGAPEREKAYGRARELCERIGEERELVPILWNLTQLHIERAELTKAHQLAEHTLRLAAHLHDSTLHMGAYYNCAELSYRQGEPQQARLLVDKVLSLYERKRAVESLAVYGIDLRLGAALFLALSEQLLGVTDEASRQMRKAIDWAHELSHPYSLAIGCVCAANLYQMRGEAEASRDFSRQALAVCEQYGFPELESWAHCFLGWSLVMLGRGGEGLETIALGLTQYRATGGNIFLSCFLRLLADGWSRAGNAEQASAALDRAFAYVRESGERIDEAELYRLKGEVLITQEASATEQAENFFREAIGIARRQQTRWWELRATTSLARLLAKQGRREQARTMLAEIYNWFTEGLDTSDLQDARALLDQLAG
jgi:predicted ATPase